MKYLFALVGVMALLLVGWVALKPVAGPLLPALPAFMQPEPQEEPELALAPVAGAPAENGMDDEFADVPLDEEAIASLRGGRIFGDPRSPPIEYSAPAEMASAEELADPARYAEYEGRQEKKLKRAYVIEAEKYVAELRSNVARGRAGGIPPDEIAKVEKKIKGIEEMRAKLLRDDPTLLGSADQEP
jgi:hypothetical protein